MKKHALKTPKNTETLRHVLWSRWNRAFWRGNGRPARMKSAKGKTGYTRQEIRSITEQGEVGQVEGVRFIESPSLA